MGLDGTLVLLRPLHTADSATVRAWLDEPELVRRSAPFRPVHEVAHDRWFASLGADRTHEIFGIERLDGGDLVGTVQLVGIDAVHRSAEMRIRIGAESARGKGFGTEALQLLLDHARRDLNLRRVWAHVFASNEAARRSYRKAGFEDEGVLRDAAWIDGEWCDVVAVAALLDPRSAPST